MEVNIGVKWEPRHQTYMLIDEDDSDIISTGSEFVKGSLNCLYRCFCKHRWSKTSTSVS